ncbi:MAG: hypothetical protein P8N09_00430 [Planctomycetota bacterium]|jgi:hypothetical protein|nr:hypothetical protein [Planctomycetota bacterium]
MNILRLGALFGVLSTTTGCLGSDDPSSGTIANASIESDARAIAASYPDWGGPVDFQLRFGPVACRMPRSTPRFSASSPGGPHAEKLYLVHASDASRYAGVDYSSLAQGGMLMPEESLSESLGVLPKRRPPLPELSHAWEQILVKEAFAPTLAREGEDEDPAHTFGEFVPAVRGEENWIPGDSAGLFLMLRTARDTPGTDEGWVYATVQADGVVSATGQIASCMDCHRRAGPDRMFGLPGVDHIPTVSD